MHDQQEELKKRTDEWMQSLNDWKRNARDENRLASLNEALRQLGELTKANRNGSRSANGESCTVEARRRADLKGRTI